MAKTLDIDYAQSTIGGGTYTGSARNYRNTSIVLTAVSVDTPRYECGIDGIVQGVLIEPAVTDYLPNNNALTDVAWGNVGSTVTLPTTIPDISGGTGGFLFDDDLALSTHNTSLDLTGVPDNSPICSIAVVKPASGIPFANLMLKTKNNFFPVARFDFDNGTIGTRFAVVGTTIYTHGMRYWGGGYYLCWFSVNSMSGAQVPKFFVGSANSAQLPSYTGADNTMHIAFCGVQDGYHPKQLFATTTGNETKTADTLTYASGNQPTNGFSIELDFIGGDFTQTAGTIADRYLYHSGNFSIRITDNEILANFNGTQLVHTETIQKDQLYKIAVGKTTSGAWLYVNGNLSDSSGSLTAAITVGTIYVGSDNSGANQCSSPVARLAIDNAYGGP